MELSEIKEYFIKRNIEYVGCIPFEEALPLIECRAKKRIPENAKTVIVCLFPYYIGKYEKRNISRYALGSDYHLVAGNILKDISEELSLIYNNFCFSSFIDSSPIREIAAAEKAGLGSRGQNNQLINERYGSYTFIGSIVTDAVFIDDLPHSKENLCLNCGKCIAACPSKALCNDGFNKGKCRSFITQKKGELSEEEINQIKLGKFVWGCDICNDVCPINKNPVLTPIKEMYKNICPVITYENVSEIKDKAFEYRGEKVIRRNIEIINEK